MWPREARRPIEPKPASRAASDAAAPLGERSLRVHGGPNDAELLRLGLDRAAVLDFSASTNPYGPSAAVSTAVGAADISRYPDDRSLLAREALAGSLGIDAGRLVLGNGAAELLWTAQRVLMNEGQVAAIAEPTFCEFRLACEAARCPVASLRSGPEQAFRIDARRLVELALHRGARVVYLCSPNTPTGAFTPAAEVAELAGRHPQLAFLLDQSFLSLSDPHEDARTTVPSNVVIVRSLTKDFGIPGLRLGYLVGEPAVAEAVATQRPAWTVSAMAQAAAVAAAGDAEFVARSRERLRASRQWLCARLRELRLEPQPSVAPFVLVSVPQAVRVRDNLLRRHGMLVRECSSFGLAGYFRISVRRRSALQRLVEALRTELSELPR